MFARTDLLAAALAHAPGKSTIGEVEREVAALEKAGALHAVDIPGAEESLATAKTVAEERETIASMRAGAGRGQAAMRSWMVQGHLNKGPLTAGQKEAVKLILSAKDRTVGVQGYAGTGKTTMLNRARVLAAKKGYRMAGLAPSASAVRTLAAEAGIESETLQRFLARNAGVAEGRLTRKGAREMRAAFAKTILVVDEGSLASTVQARDLLRIANALRIPRVVLVGDAKQLDAVDAGKPFAQLQAAGMRDRGDGRDHAPARSRPEGSRRGEPERRCREGVREARKQCRRGEARQYRGRGWPRGGSGSRRSKRENTGVMAPSHELRQAVNGHIRERLAREGRIRGPSMQGRTPGVEGATPGAEKALADNYGPGDVVAFHRAPTGASASKRVTSGASRGVDRKARAGAARRRQGRGRPPGNPERSAGAGAAARSTASRKSSSGRATASAGPATMPALGLVNSPHRRGWSR